MKSRIYFYAFLLLVIFKSNCVYGQTSSDDKQVLGMLKTFYTEYMTTVSKDDPRVSLKKTQFLQKKYCTLKLLKRVPALSDQIDADPFLKAQDSSVDCLKTLTIKKDAKVLNQYIVSYVDVYSQTKFVIFLTVIKENNIFKISSIHW